MICVAQAPGPWWIWLLLGPLTIGVALLCVWIVSALGAWRGRRRAQHRRRR